ncbi:MAG: ATP-binding protein [Tissierellales bacterium]|nr:ATP-binding protein [Tissierellales bacterium]MBN2828639.1 ATP-binding protein [Tissierellales bacterium]
MKEEIVNKIKKDYQRNRLKATEDLKTRKEEIYDMIPRMKEIDQAIASLSLELARMLISKGNDWVEKTNYLRETLSLLKSEKSHIMQKRKIPAIYFEEVYQCQNCRDTGYDAHGEMCFCYRQKLINELYNVSGLGELLKRENFDAFDSLVFSDSKYGSEKMTPRDNIKLIAKHSQHFITHFETHDRNMLFYGSTGVGKTFMCNCIAKELIDKGILVLYQTAFKMFEIISEHKFNRNLESYANKDNFSMIYEADLLILDDLGTESINSFTTTELFNIINTRMITNKKTIISTNLSLERMSETYSDRIMSRIISKYDIFKFYGKDIRTRRGPTC